MNMRFGGLVLAAALALAALAGLGWAATATAAATVPAQSGSIAPAGAAAPPGPAVDPRWLQLVRALAAPPDTHAPASSGPTIEYLITDQVLAGHVPLPDTVAISLTRGANVLYAFSLTPFPDGSGLLYSVSLSGPPYYLPPNLLLPGDVIWVTQANQSISLSVPVLNGVAWPASDMVSGAAPANAALQLFLYPANGPATVYTRTAAANGSGQYSVAWSPAVDLRPADSGFVLYAPGVNRHAYARFVAPLLRAQVGGFGIDGDAAPLSQVFVTVTTGAGAVLGTDFNWADAAGVFAICYGACQYRPGVPANTAGDIVWATAAGQAFSLTLPALTARQSGDTVFGQAPPGRAVTVARYDGPAPYLENPPLLAGQTTVTASLAGSYAASLPLRSPNYGAASVTDSQGNQAYARYAVPYLSAMLGQSQFGNGYSAAGQVDDTAAPLTITIQGASGYIKSVDLGSAASTGFFVDPTNKGPTGIELAAGDQITVTSPRGVQITDTLPLLTAQADVSAQTISGQAPPHAPVRLSLGDYDVSFNPPGSSHTFVVTASAQGNYSLSFAPYGSFGPSLQGLAVYTSTRGLAAQRVISVLQNCLPQLYSVQVAGNQLSGATGVYKPDCGTIVLTLQNGQGQTVFSQTIEPYAGAPLELALSNNGHPVLIEPGDHIRFTNNTQTSDYRVPALSVAVDQPGGHISGQAPPGAALSVDVKNEGFFHQSTYSNVTLTTTASAQGAYQLSDPLRPGDQVEASLAGTPRFYADRPAPVLHAWLYESAFEGWTAPFAAYTLTLQTSRPITLPSTAGTADAFGYVYSSGQAPWTFQPGDRAVFTSASTVRSLTMPTLTAQFDPASQTVTGLGPPGQTLLVTLSGGQVVTVSAQGRYTATFGAQSAGTFGSVIYTSSSGDQAGLAYNAAQFWVTLDSPCLMGYVPLPSVPTTLTLSAAGGALKGTLLVHAAFYDGSFSVCFAKPAAVESGDRLSLATLDGPLTFTVPVLTASHDADRQLIRGSAPPNSLVSVYLPDLRVDPTLVSQRVILAGADGSFAIDISDMQLNIGASATASWRDARGDWVRWNFTIQGRQTFLPLIGRP